MGAISIPNSNASRELNSRSHHTVRARVACIRRVPRIANVSMLSASSINPSTSRWRASWNSMGGSSIVKKISGLSIGSTSLVEKVEVTPPIMNAIVGGNLSLHATRDISVTRIRILKKESNGVKGTNLSNL